MVDGWVQSTAPSNEHPCLAYIVSLYCQKLSLNWVGLAATTQGWGRSNRGRLSWENFPPRRPESPTIHGSHLEDGPFDCLPSELRPDRLNSNNKNNFIFIKMEQAFQKVQIWHKYGTGQIMERQV